MSSEDVVLRLIKFVSETGRLPRPDEPGLDALLNEVNTHFGSLNKALEMAGLLTPTTKSTRRSRTRRLSAARARSSKTSAWSAYPKNYFLNLLNLTRTSHYGSPAPSGTPTWWERRANAEYRCSSCNGTIEKGEKYIARRKLRPGKRGIYGYRGSYLTNYYHIVCLLRKAKTEIEKDIRVTNSEISGIKGQIADFTKEISLRRERIGECQIEIQQVREDYALRGFWGKVRRWFGSRYTLWSRNRETSRLEREIAHMQRKEIPEREAQIYQLRRRINDLEHKLDGINPRIQELASRQQS